MEGPIRLWRVGKAAPLEFHYSSSGRAMASPSSRRSRAGVYTGGHGACLRLHHVHRPHRARSRRRLRRSASPGGERRACGTLLRVAASAGLRIEPSRRAVEEHTAVLEAPQAARGECVRAGGTARCGGECGGRCFAVVRERGGVVLSK